MAPELEAGTADAGESPLRVGIFGGTFDPPHVGHLIVAGDVMAALDLDRMVWIPAGRPPHKVEHAATSASVRLAMTAAAVRNDPGFEVSDVEVVRTGPSYTVDTLRALRATWPAAALHLVIGADQCRAFHTWREPEEVAGLARLAVMDRAGSEAGALDPGIGVAWDRIPVTRIDISSTDLRDRAARGQSLRYRVPEGVRRIIEDEGLYTRGS